MNTVKKYNERIYPTVEISIMKGHYTLYFDYTNYIIRMFVNIAKSTRQGKKMMTVFYDEPKKKVKTTHFGASGYEDYTTHE